MSTNNTSLPGNGTHVPSSPKSDQGLLLTFYVSERHAYLSRVLVGVTTTLVFFCTLVFFTRIYLRLRPVFTIGLDDCFLIIGYCLSVVDWAFLLVAGSTKPGVISMDTVIDQGRHGWLSIGIWGVAMSCLKISIALTLLRIQRRSLRWRMFLLSIIGLQAIYAILNLVFNLFIACRPLNKAWDPRVTTGSCVPIEVMRAASNFTSGFTISTDVMLALAPTVFLRNIDRPLRERIFICVLMSLGLFVTAASTVKFIQVQKFYDPRTPPEEFMPVTISCGTYSTIELFTCALAASIPALKGILQGGLRRMGVSLTEVDSSGVFSGSSHIRGYSVHSTITLDASNPFHASGGSSVDLSRYNLSNNGGNENSLEMHRGRKAFSKPKPAYIRPHSFAERDSTVAW